jgi:Zn-finger nucleic acid-binding protein
MEAAQVGTTSLRECSKCHGVWVDPVMLEQICTNNEKQVALLGNTSEASSAQGRDLEKIRYLPCPVCRQLMNRLQFANCSRVIVDVCKKHGTWFDRDELRRIVEFIRTGGLLTAREREIAELEAKRKKLMQTQAIMAGLTPDPPESMRASDISDVISAAGKLLHFFLR